MAQEALWKAKSVPKRLPRELKWTQKSTPKAVQDHSSVEKSETAKILILLCKIMVFEGLGGPGKPLESPRKAFGRHLDLQVGLLNRLWATKLVSWTASGPKLSS